MKKILFIVLIIFSVGCNDTSKKIKSIERKVEPKKKLSKKKILLEEPTLFLNEKTAIPFLFEYQQKNKENKVRISTAYGDIDLILFENTPYHRANFIYLTKLGYFNDTFFHRVVPDFVIQGGNSDHPNTWLKRRRIGRYLLPQDNNKGYKHHRGILSIPSSEEKNPHKLASPYEFFIVKKKDGAYHLDKNYTAFGKVIKGMEVVDEISNLETDKREWPLDNVRFKIEIIQ